MIKNVLFTLLFLLCFHILSSQHIIKKENVYKSNDITLTLREDSTFEYKVSFCDICPNKELGEVVGYGRYLKYKNKAYYLFSSGGSLMGTAVENINNNNKQDSISIFISSPFEDSIRKDVFFKNLMFYPVFYQIMVLYSKDSIDKLYKIHHEKKWWSENLYCDTINKICYFQPKFFFTNEIQIYKPIDFPIYKIILKIYPNTSNYRINTAFFAITYFLKNSKSNDIVFRIPFKYSLFAYDSFFGKRVDIIDNNAVAIDDRTILYREGWQPKNKKEYSRQYNKWRLQNKKVKWLDKVLRDYFETTMFEWEN